MAHPTATTYQPEYSYEATTMDYMSPLWHPFGEPTLTEAEAEAQVAAARAEGAYYEPVAYRVTPVLSEAEAAERARAYQAALDAEEASLPREGRAVTVVKGRKVPVGTTGTVFWYGPDRYAPAPSWGPPKMRVGFTTPEGVKHFTAASNVEVTAASVVTTT